MKRLRVLVVDDDVQLLAMLEEYLASEGYDVHTETDGTRALATWKRWRPDFVILDWMLPGTAGIDVCREIRKTSDVPIIMLSARGAESDKLVGLELGADDYVTKPFSPRELSARMRTVLRRASPGGVSVPSGVIQIGSLCIDPQGFNARCGDREIPLTATEFKLLAAMARHPNRVFTRVQLMDAALGDYFEGYERTIDSHISHLRQKLAQHCPKGRELIQTVHGVGYKMIDPH